MKRAFLALLVVVSSHQLLGDETVKVEVGKKAPDFEVTGIDGKRFKLSEKLKSGRDVALMFSRANW